MDLDGERIVKCSMIDGSILKDYTSMLYDANSPSDIPAKFWESSGANSPKGNKILDVAATSDHKWLFASCDGGWWAIINLQLDKCVKRQVCELSKDGNLSVITSIGISPDDKVFYMVTNTGLVES
jgi:hypothetical protein